ncbi:MAG: purine-nucleoside phosphorylase [Proteobacteria bacterium]|nr:purine-nucleoside phosphorylase [Pseudomonadota bacterium]MBU1388340.1 purine-nucleoside phosphorylase [Pseudomonadota bacterium]MBU1542836.1 purine-nucleoside phosphorylase [Pseudomonadota bacterium]MBU2430688.1 purine-nucleoside phosphorylase [Pseudomonadota bacterium]MBU2482955.1 purine-nucleoside phosphorylase [Pseudomonadota bacterium]
MKHHRPDAIETARFFKSRIKQTPSIGFITGTGLSGALETFTISHRFDYAQVPHFPLSTVPSHKGQVSFGDIKGHTLMMMQGRFHLYEGYSPAQVTFPIRVMQEMGVKILILSNAAGGINLNFSDGDIMVITDHINLTGKNPLTGPNEDQWGVRFPDMIQVYDPELAAIAAAAAEKCNIRIRKGVYAGLAGPSLETPAETRFLKTIGADAVGFSTVMEAIAGIHADMNILGLSLITNINNPDKPVATSLQSVLETARRSEPSFNRLVCEIISRI